MTGGSGSLPSFLALAGSAVFASASVQPTLIAKASPPSDASARDAAKSVLVRFELVPSANGARTVMIVLDNADQPTALGEVPAAALCEAQTRNESDAYLAPPPDLHVACGGGLNARVTSEPAGLRVLVRNSFEDDAPTVTQTLPLPAGSRVEFSDTLLDPAPTPLCDGREQAEVKVTLERGQPPGHRFSDEARVRASLPVEARIEVPNCERTCVGKRDEQGAHYEYVCRCSAEPHATGIVMEVRDGALFAKTYSSAPCTGYTEQHGGWRLPCGAHLRFPQGTEVLPYGEYGFEDSPKEIRALTGAREQIRAAPASD